jgi:outer membrane protein OmpA-like peptidoglycan-associated protein
MEKQHKLGTFVTRIILVLGLFTINTVFAIDDASDTDSDGDGILNSIDIDDDNDGILDVQERDGDFDSDGIINRLDLDADGDGINDLEESGLREPQQDPLDADNDGQIDPNQDFGTDGLATALAVAKQPDYSGDGKADTPNDSDADSHPDFLDLDSDNDGISDPIEAGIDVLIKVGKLPAEQTHTNHPLNSDSGEIADYRDLDSDNDGLADIVEAGGIDKNGDGRVDNFIDQDNNGIDDNSHATIVLAVDTDGDGHADYRELDSDNDGLPDLIEAGGTDTNLNGQVDDFLESGDADGITDTLNNSSGGQALADFDSDADGTADRLDTDSDNDGVTDITEAGLEDSDGDGLVDDFTDNNNDGYDDNAQAVLSSAGAIPDSDSDGISDYREYNYPEYAFQSGIKGHGLGSTDGLLLGFLLVMLAWRRQRLALTFAFAALLIFPLTTLAEKSPKDRDFEKRWYVGANTGISFLDPEAQCPCYSVSDDLSTGVTAFLGRDMSRHFSIEAYYADLGEAGVDFNGANAGDIGYEHFGLSMLAYFYNRGLADGFNNDYDDEGFFHREGYSVFARAGLGNMDNNANITEIKHERVESQHIHLGIGVEYGWPNGYAARVEFVSYDIDAKILSLGVLKRFGTLKSYNAPVSESGQVPVFIQKPTQFFKQTVYFEDGTWEITGASRELLVEMAETMNQRKNLRILVRGHTNSDGGEKRNFAVSKRQAKIVARHLQSLGIHPNRIEMKAFGETMPVEDNNTEEGKHLNRRVDFETIR